MGKALDEQLKVINRASEEREAERRAQKFGLPYLDLSKSPVELAAFKHIKEAEARSALIAPVKLDGKKLVVAAFDPALPAADKIFKTLARDSGLVLDIVVVSMSGLRYAWGFYAQVPSEAAEITGMIGVPDAFYGVLESKAAHFEDAQKLITEMRTIEMKTEEVFSTILGLALLHRASDVHFEPGEYGVRIRYRIDGVLHDVASKFSKDSYHALLSRVKLLGKLKLNIIAEPQNGRITVGLPGGKEVEIRVSVVPSEFGETTVLRILYAEALNMTLADLGFRPDDLAIIEHELKEPNGMILNTGPTGAGKTTTLYVFLKAKKKPEIKIITIEDPIEYHLEGIEQTQVEPAAGYNFVSALKSILRQDPDVILVGEINDEETAAVGMQAALTGHLVFATVHANNAPAAIPRLLDLGIKTQTVGPALNLIIAQRLVRKLCEHCRAPMDVAKERRNKIEQFLSRLPKRVARPPISKLALYEAKGCPKCGGFGYKGRVGLFELFLVDDVIERVLRTDVTEAGLTDAAKRQGMTTIQQDGILKAITGLTTLEEIEAVTGPADL